MSTLKTAKKAGLGKYGWAIGLIAIAAIVVIVWSTVTQKSTQVVASPDDPKVVAEVCRGMQADVASLTAKSTDAETVSAFIGSARKRLKGFKSQGDFSLYLHILAQTNAAEAAKSGTGASSQYNTAVGRLNSLCLKALTNN